MLFLILLPGVSAHSDVFVAANFVAIDPQIPAGGARFASLFSVNHIQNDLTLVQSAAPLDYTATNMTLVSNGNTCGMTALEPSDNITVTLMVNEIATDLSVVCPDTAVTDEIFFDNSTVTIRRGDRVVLRLSAMGGALPQDPEFSVTIEGKVIDTTNETLETVTIFLPILLFVGAIIWAERTREMWIYVLAALAGATSVITLPEGTGEVRVLMVLAIVAIVIRLIQHGTESRL